MHAKIIDTLKELLASEEGEYKKLVEQIKALLDEKGRFEEKIANYKKLISSYGEVIKEEGGQPGKNIPTGRTKRNLSGGSVSVIKSLVDSVEGEYTIQDIKSLFAEQYPDMEFSRYSFHNAIKNRVKTGRTKLVTKGAGTTPAIYKNLRQENLFEMVSHN